MRPDHRFRARPGAIAILLALALGAAACSGDDEAATTTTAPKAAAEDELRLNQIQVIGTHNSFHEAPPAAELDLLRELNAEQANQRTYSHPAIRTQLEDQRIRQLELDIFVDTEGGRYADPALRAQAGLGDLDVPEMDEPGIKVLHEQDVDYHSVCPTLVTCLREVKAWSDANPDHVPVAIALQLKDGPLIFDVPEQAVPEPWDGDQLDALEEEIASVFPKEQIITPDDVRGDRATLNEAVRAGEWPTLGESRGKVLFALINAEPYRSRYLANHPGLEGALLFTNSDVGRPEAAYVGLDDPEVDGDAIRELVEQGYLVRTRADANSVEAQANDPTRLELALASGAQWIATDYPGPDGALDAYGSGYRGQLPGFLAARCNPVTAPKACVDEAVEPD